ncbi:MAG: hypothetical protein KA748_06655 [Halomonas sp.]|nr:hypothetical protein [Halomonas sp.]MBP5979868.1 hypothetical protein [Halomonas sp.]
MTTKQHLIAAFALVGGGMLRDLAIIATFYIGLGALIAPSVLYLVVRAIF